MKTLLTCAAALMVSLLTSATAADTRCYEMRTYHAAPGKFDDMLARFRNHTVKLFAKHGMVNLGYWVPMDEKDGSANRLVYILAYPSRAAREKSWEAFLADPDWIAAKTASEVNGTLVDKVESVFLTATDYSPIR